MGKDSRFTLQSVTPRRSAPGRPLPSVLLVSAAWTAFMFAFFVWACTPFIAAFFLLACYWTPHFTKIGGPHPLSRGLILPL